ncbi:MAG: glucose-6-phosphate isomerase, partial [Deltaproteobacteria bacterium]|nr:glucose-6-phosphate isomerase [Deltaproteobacteria bacterium]
MLPLDRSPAFQALAAHHAEAPELDVRRLFADDPRRAVDLAVELPGLTFDYSKHRVTRETLRLLVALAEERGVAATRDAMFAGEPLNVTEGRAVLHVALRAAGGPGSVAGGKDVSGEVAGVLARVLDFAERVRSGA